MDDVANAMIHMISRQTIPFDVFNVSTDDHLLVKEIADIVVKEMCLSDVEYQFTGGKRGWKGDVPVYRLNTTKIRKTGWKHEKNSVQSVVSAVRFMLENKLK